MLIDNLEQMFAEKKPDQCIRGVRFMIDRVRELQPLVYMEIGCAKLNTFSVYQSLLGPSGLAIGVDLKEYPEWKDYRSPNGTDYFLRSGGSTDPNVIKQVKEKLGGRKIDFLFIDGNHYDPFPWDDWENFSPLVRKGGLVAFHDWDPGAVSRGQLEGQGAAIACNRLVSQGRKILSVPNTSIGMAYLYV